MTEVDNEQFQQLIDEALTELPGEHINSIKNVAILYEEDPTPDQRQQLELRHNQTLLGLYEGVPLTKRQGMTYFLPDRITLFKGPLVRRAPNIDALKEDIKHTLWHEVAHYYGLDHDQIRDKE